MACRREFMPQRVAVLFDVRGSIHRGRGTPLASGTGTYPVRGRARLQVTDHAIRLVRAAPAVRTPLPGRIQGLPRYPLGLPRDQWDRHERREFEAVDVGDVRRNARVIRNRPSVLQMLDDSGVSIDKFTTPFFQARRD